MTRLMVLGLLTGGLIVLGMSESSQAGHGGCCCGRSSHRSYGQSYNSFRYYSPRSYGYSSYDYYRPSYSGIRFGSPRFSFSSGYSPSYHRYGSSRYWHCR